MLHILCISNTHSGKKENADKESNYSCVYPDVYQMNRKLNNNNKKRDAFERLAERPPCVDWPRGSLAAGLVRFWLWALVLGGVYLLYITE